jgi:hypothetical protein
LPAKIRILAINLTEHDRAENRIIQPVRLPGMISTGRRE